jgi:MFS family permease
MLEAARAVFSLLLSFGLLLLANGLFGTLLGVRATLEGFPAEVTGMVMSGHFVGLFIGAMFAIRVVAAVGHIRSFAAFASIMSVAVLCHILLVDPVVWFGLRVVTGFCMAGMVMVTESWLNERAGVDNRGQIMALYMITNYLGAAVGQTLLPLSDPAQFQIFCVVSIIYSVALVPVLLTRAKAPAPAQPQRASFKALWRTSPLGLIGACVAGLNNASFLSLGPVFASKVGLDLVGTSIFMTLVLGGGLLTQWPVGRLSDHVDRRWVLIGVAAVTAAAALGMTTVEPGRALFLNAFAYGGACFVVYSVSLAHTNDFADPDRRVQTASGLLIAYATGAVIGPVVSGFLMGSFGPRALYVFVTAVMATLALFAFYRMTRRAVRDVSQRRRAIVLPGGQFTAGQLYSAMRDQMDRDLGRMSGGESAPRGSSLQPEGERPDRW